MVSIVHDHSTSATTSTSTSTFRRSAFSVGILNDRAKGCAGKGDPQVALLEFLHFGSRRSAQAFVIGDRRIVICHLKTEVSEVFK